MTDAKTIDNLGPETHKRFIENTKLLSDADIAKFFASANLGKISDRTTSIITDAVSGSELDKFLGFEQKTSNFMSPPVIPTDILKFNRLIGPLPGKIVLNKLNEIKVDKKKSKLGDEKKILENFAKTMINLNKIISEIAKKLHEYKKG